VRLGRLLGVVAAGDAGAALSREELFAGWRLFFERLAAIQPVVLLVEDAHYADTGLLDFLDNLIDWVRDLPVYVLVFARPELGQARPGFGAGRNRSTLTLDPLDDASMDRLVDALVPVMPPAARARIIRQAQGVPLFAVETVRSLIDRDIVQPVEGVYRLVGELSSLGELAVPDSLHALLAARLDALDPEVRRLVADAAVLGSTFPAEALIAVSGREEAAVRAALADLVRREVLSVSADPLSPERGSYSFAQEMLRQVAYDTLSRRDRKARHLKVAAHLRSAFAGEGEEVADVIARHYLDALHAVPEDSDAGQIRDQAVAALIRAAERAERTGASGRAATSYATAAELDPAGPEAAALWERAARASQADVSYQAAIEYAERARRRYLEDGQDRPAARALATSGRTLRLWGRHAEARDQLTDAVRVLRAEPDADTVRALKDLAILQTFDGSPDAGEATSEALTMGQALGVDRAQLGELFLVRGLYHLVADRRPQAIAYLRESARLAEQAGDSSGLGRAQLNLSDALSATDPAAAAEVARSAMATLRRTGERYYLTGAILNLAEALLQLGDWEAAEAEMIQAAEADGLADIEDFTCEWGWLAALRGDDDRAEALLGTLQHLRVTEDPQLIAGVSIVEAFLAESRRQLPDALRHARVVVAQAATTGIGSVFVRWAWPLAARAAHELGEASAVRDLLAELDTYQPGYLVPMLRAERDLVRARLAGADAGVCFAAAIQALREQSTPYHLAHGLLDQARYLFAQGDADAAALAIEEAGDIAGRLHCRPLLDRAAALTGAPAPAGLLTSPE